MIAVISVLAVLAVLIAGDRVANAVAQNALAGQLQSELSTPTKPEVTSVVSRSSPRCSAARSRRCR